MRLSICLGVLVIGVVAAGCRPGPRQRNAEPAPAPVTQTAEGEGDVESRLNIAFDAYSPVDLGDISNRQRAAYCELSSEERDAYTVDQHAQAEDLSRRLDEYIRAWHGGQAEARLPDGLLPRSMDNAKTPEWTLYRPEEITAEEQWYMRPAHEIPADFSQLYFLSPDNHVSYFKVLFVAPLGSQLLVEGDFPHARFMDYQILAPFDPSNPTTSGLGAPEVSIVDVDIEPDPGSTNPFRAGADRTATARHYHLDFDLKAGNALELNPEAMQIPAYRGPGNTRTGGPFAPAGPMGIGQFVPSVLWLRYYAPDKTVGPLGGVPLPKVTLRLPSGESFWLQPDLSTVARVQTLAVPGKLTPPAEPAAFNGPKIGWYKIFGLWLTLADAAAQRLVEPQTIIPKEWATRWIVNRDHCLYGRGPDAAPIGNYESSASMLNYNSYLVRVMALGEEKVYVLTGKLPTTPKTRDGEPTATTAQARYWSLCHTGNGGGLRYPGLLYGCLMDDEIVTDEDNRFVLVYARGEERPANATAECGVTWQDFGLESTQAFTLRWMSVMPDDHLPGVAPHQDVIPWETGEWSQPGYDPTLIGTNNQDGIMGPYQPLVHYMTKAEFEQLGCPIAPEAVPVWQ